MRLLMMSGFILLFFVGSAEAAAVTIKSPGTGSAWTLTFPTSAGSSTYVFETNGSGTTSWVPEGGSPLSSVTAALASSTINNTLFAQTWTWNTLSTGTGMTFSSSSLTTGSILSLQNTNAALASTGQVLNISNATTGAGYGVSSTMSGQGTTGYAGYFTDTSASGVGYAVFGTSASSAGYGGYFANTASGYALKVTETAYFNGNVGIDTATPSAILSIDYTTTGAVPFIISDSGTILHEIDTNGNIHLGAPIYGTYIGTDSDISGKVAYSDYGETNITCSFYTAATCNIYVMPAHGGFVGVNQLNPEATLDVGGFIRLTPESAQPAACSSTNSGALALTANYTLCVCKGSASAWYLFSNGTTACSW